MEFASILTTLEKEFREKNVGYLLIGGFALGLWGANRSTIDLDFLVLREDIGKVDDVMTKLGYELAFRSENVSQFSSSLKAFGGVDFLHAFREASREMFKRGMVKGAFGNKLSLLVAAPEDIIGLKLQALTNDSERRGTDLLDIRNLVSLHRNILDWTLIEKYCKIFKQDEILKELRNA